MHLPDILLCDEELRMEHVNVRGLARSIGILSKTPPCTIEACQEHYRSVSVPLPGKHDFVMVNGEKLRKRELHGVFTVHHRSFLEKERGLQK
jgi:hypothetical protein